MSPGIRRFILIWLGQTLSLVGSQLTAFGLGVWLYQRTGSAAVYGLSLVATVAPYILVSPLAGGLVDRRSQKQVLLLSNCGAAACVLLIATMLWRDALPTWGLLLAMAGISSFSALEFPALSALTTQEVPQEQLGRANGLVQLGFAVGQILGPWGGGLLLSSIGLAGILVIDGVTFLVASLILACVRFQPARRQPSRAEGRGGGLADMLLYGFRYIRQRPGLPALLLLFCATNFNMGILQVATAPLVLGFSDARGLGTVLSAGGMGMLVGSGVMIAWGGPKRHIRCLLLLLLLQGLFLVVASLYRSLLPVAGCAFGVLFTMPLINGCSQTVWQRMVPLEVQGRVFAVRSMLARASIPVANILGGLLVDRLFRAALERQGAGRGGSLLLVVIGLLTMASAVAGWLHGRIRALDGEPPGETPGETTNGAVTPGP